MTRRSFFVALSLIAGGTILALFLEGRSWEGACPGFALWEGDIWSACCSQRFLDPYSLTHVLHGMVLCGVLALALPGLSRRSRFLVALALEGVWEVVENSPPVIQRYRDVTIALGYVGDSILNSMSDLLCCGLGFLLAQRLGWKRSLAFFLLAETALLLWVRDSLTLNVLMLIHPVEAVKVWQMGH